MNRKTKIVIFSILTIGLVGTCSLLNTRLGVHFALDVLSEMGSSKELQTSATEGPMRLTRELSPIETITLPFSIEQPLEPFGSFVCSAYLFTGYLALCSPLKVKAGQQPCYCHGLSTKAHPQKVLKFSLKSNKNNI